LINPETLPIDIILPVSGYYRPVKKTIEAILENTLIPFNLIIIDNGIADENLHDFLVRLKDKNNNIQLIAKGTQTGFSASVNKGIEVSRSAIIAILECNTIVARNWLTKLVSVFSENNNIGIVSPRCNNKFFPQFGLDLNITNIENHLQEINYSLENMKMPAFSPSPIATAYCMAIKREVLAKCGGFDTIYGDYSLFSDLDLCFRASKKDFAIMLNNNNYVYINEPSKPDLTKIAVNYTVFKAKWANHPYLAYLPANMFPDTRAEFFHHDQEGFYSNDRLKADHKRYLLINPSIIDGPHLQAHIRKVVPSGLLRVANYLINDGNKINFYDFDPFSAEFAPRKSELKAKFEVFELGRTFEDFHEYIKNLKDIDEVFVSLTMTYNYPNSHLKTLIDIIKSVYGDIKITFGGVYVSLCPDEIKKLDVEVHTGPYHSADDLRPLIEITDEKDHAILRIVKGCPRTCSYCVVPALEGRLLTHYQKENIIKQFQEFYALGYRNYAFWDSNLLFGKENLFILMDYLVDNGYTDSITLDFSYGLEFALIEEDFISRLNKFKLKSKICVPLESSEYEIYKDKFLRPSGHLGYITKAVKKLQSADYKNMNFYVMLGLPYQTMEQVLKTLIFGWRLGLLPLMMTYTPIPGTEDYRRYLPLFADKDYWELNPCLFPCESEELSSDILLNLNKFNYTRLRYTEKEGYFITAPSFIVENNTITTRLDAQKIEFNDQNAIMKMLKELVYSEDIRPEELDERTFRTFHNLSMIV
jgi:GT2 family glycosyltransferase